MEPFWLIWFKWAMVTNSTHVQYDIQVSWQKACAYLCVCARYIRHFYWLYFLVIIFQSKKKTLRASDRQTDSFGEVRLVICQCVRSGGSTRIRRSTDNNNNAIQSRYGLNGFFHERKNWIYLMGSWISLWYRSAFCPVSVPCYYCRIFFSC